MLINSACEDSAFFLDMTWNAAGQAAGCRRQNEREKSKTSPNLRRGLLQSKLGFAMRAIFEKAKLGTDAVSI